MIIVTWYELWGILTDAGRRLAAAIVNLPRANAAA